MQKKIEYEENSDLSVSSNESDNDHELTKKFEKDYALIKKMRKEALSICTSYDFLKS